MDHAFTNVQDQFAAAEDLLCRNGLQLLQEYE